MGERLSVSPPGGGSTLQNPPAAITGASANGHPRIEEVGENVFALSQLVDLSRPVSWVAPGVGGYSPSTAYLIRDGDESVLLDTGVAAQRNALIAQVKHLLPRSHRLAVCLTRNEPDCVGNLHALVNAFRVTRIISRTPSHPLDYAGPFSYAYPHIAFDNRLRDGELIELGGRPRLKVLDGAVRTLITKWFYDAPTGALFTSDFFTHTLVSADWIPKPHPSPEQLQAHLGAKFDWLWLADTTRPIERLDAVMADNAVTALLPQHGLWIVGHQDVQTAYRETRDAVSAMGRGQTPR